MKSLYPHPAQRGIALVIVLAFLVLIAGLTIAFFSNVSAEFSAARSFADAVTTKQLADSAANVVMGQIREATALEGGGWASQPGMIRVYGTETGGSASSKVLLPSEKLHSLYKLYSSEELVATGSVDLDKAAAGETFGKWWDFPAAFTDLNQPVKLTLPGTGPAYRYPIMDPSFARSVAAGGIVVEGFDLADDPGDTRKLPREEKIARMPARWIYVLRDGTLTAGTLAGSTIVWNSATPAPSRPSADNPIVGRIAYWTDDETSKVNINTAGGFSTKDIPTDYNERSYAGSFWDTPRTLTFFDRGMMDTTTGALSAGGSSLSLGQVLSGEFQRYPGHPATTSLGLIFRNLLSSEQIYQLTPRFNGGGSLGGTERLLTASSVPLPLKKERLYSSVDELLFASTSDPNGSRQLNSNHLSPPLGASPTNPAATNPISPESLDKTRFFLTAHSRGPELNLQGRPRVALWPEHTDNAFRNASDRLIAFSSTVGGKPFYFQRENAYSPVADAGIPRNADVYDYLRSVTSLGVPGFGSTSFASKLGTADRDQILTEMFDYIRTVNLRDSTRDKVLNLLPDPAKTREKEKFKFATRGIVVPIQLTRGGVKTSGFGRFPTISEASLVLYHAGYVLNNGPNKAGMPTADYQSRDYRDKFKTTDAAGDPITVTLKSNLVRAFLIFEMFNPMQGYAPTASPATYSLNKVPIVVEVTGLSAFALNSRPLGFPASTVSNSFLSGSSSTWGGRNSGGMEGFAHALLGKASPTPGSNYYPFQSSGPGLDIPLATPVLAGTRPPPQTMSLGGADLTVRVLFGPNEVSSFKMQFPSAQVPVPTDDVWLYAPTATFPPAPDPGGFYRHPTGDPSWACNASGGAEPLTTQMAEGVKSFAGRLLSADKNAGTPKTAEWLSGAFANSSADLTKSTPPGLNHINRFRQILQPGDTVRSLVFGTPTSTGGGDVRVSMITNGSSEFQRHPDYDNPNVRHAQSLRRGDGITYFGDQNTSNIGFRYGYYNSPSTLQPAPGSPLVMNAGNLIQLPTLPTAKYYPLNQSADLPSGINGVLRNDGQPGDFDTGIGNLADGAFCGKADEGNIAWRYLTTASTSPWIYVYPYYTHVYEEAFETFFTPNRQVPSAVLFGSLLRGQNTHWETLCFSPNPAGDGHPGNTGTPKDFLFLDLFHMPVVEPYAISEPFSTGGKVNMNYAIAPFNWIQRSTAMRAALQSVRVTAIPTNDYATYKTSLAAGTVNYRILLDRDQTLAASDALFKSFGPGNLDEGFYKSPAQICERFLYPSTDSRGSVVPPQSGWPAKKVSGISGKYTPSPGTTSGRNPTPIFIRGSPPNPTPTRSTCGCRPCARLRVPTPWFGLKAPTKSPPNTAVPPPSNAISTRTIAVSTGSTLIL